MLLLATLRYPSLYQANSVLFIIIIILQCHINKKKKCQIPLVLLIIMILPSSSLTAQYPSELFPGIFGPIITDPFEKRYSEVFGWPDPPRI